MTEWTKVVSFFLLSPLPPDAQTRRIIIIVLSKEILYQLRKGPARTLKNYKQRTAFTCIILRENRRII